jgi:hypothetical protein
MAKHIMLDTYVEINGTSYSDHAHQVSLNDEAEKIDVSSFGPSSYREYAVGLKDADVTVTFFQDFASGSIHSVLQPIYTNGSTCTLKLKPVGSTVGSTTNPVMTMTARLYNYGPLDGEVGAASEIEATFANAGTAGLTYGTA